MLGVQTVNQRDLKQPLGIGLVFPLSSQSRSKGGLFTLTGLTGRSRLLRRAPARGRARPRPSQEPHSPDTGAQLTVGERELPVEGGIVTSVHKSLSENCLVL